jgi:hypothetical protein
LAEEIGLPPCADGPSIGLDLRLDARLDGVSRIIEIALERPRDLEALVRQSAFEELLEERRIDFGAEPLGQRPQVLLNLGGVTHEGIVNGDGALSEAGPDPRYTGPDVLGY